MSARAEQQRERIRQRLADLGARRESHEKEEDTLTRDIQKALADATGKLTVKEQARLLRMHRTTLYRVYR